MAEINPSAIRIEQEPAGGYQHRGCISCTSAPVFQTLVFLGKKELTVKVAYCENLGCRTYAETEARRLAEYPEIRAQAK